MRLSPFLLLVALVPLFVEYVIAGKVYTVHDYRRINVARNTATVRRYGNTYVFPKYRASSSLSSIRNCRYGGYSRRCCAGWSRNRDGSCSPICTMNCVHGTCVAPDMCKCDMGYRGKSCNIDLNECGLEPRPCQHRCTNSQGSFKCYCQRGYVLQQDGRSCAVDERCYPGRCSHGCAVDGNDVICSCPPGLQLIADGYHCKDIDECADGSVTCPVDQECKNTFGNYLCVCKDGKRFQYIEGKYQCVAPGCEAYQCHNDAYCGYVDLRPECLCNEGFWGNGRICLPARIRDCSDTPCHPGVVCTDAFEDIREISGYPPEGIFEQFKCEDCPEGYHGDGIDCQDINECLEDKSNCSKNSECMNDVGDYRCECKDGFYGNGEICVAVADYGCDACYPEVFCHPNPLPDLEDEELLATLDLIYLFVCGPCPSGYEGDGIICDDVNECDMGTDDCSMNSVCTNDDGSHHCECKEGYFGNGDICVMVSDFGCDACYPEVFCNPNPLPDLEDEELLATLELIYLFVCGPCPSGYEGDGIICDDVNECDMGTDDCTINSVCVNDDGSHHCECKEGYLGNGDICVMISPITCDDKPCFNIFVKCVDVPLPDPSDIDLLMTLDIILQYECGPCPPGFEGDGEMCSDINECDTDPPSTDCDFNATCENIPGKYLCMCSDGFYGNGTHCSLLDPRTCDDGPCSPVAECFPIDLHDLNFLLPVVVQFECGPCPEGYIGDGFTCTASRSCDDDPCSPLAECFPIDLRDVTILLPLVIMFECGPCPEGFRGDGFNCTESPKFVNLTVIVVDYDDEYGDPLKSSALVRVMRSDPLSLVGTSELIRGRTGDNGLITLPCPHNESIIITAKTGGLGLFANSVTFRCNFDQTNIVTIPLHRPYEDLNYLYRPQSPREFGIGNETTNERYSTYFPKDSFEVPDGGRIQLLFRSINVSIPEELEFAPEMIACIPRVNEGAGRGDVGATPIREEDTDIRAIEAFGAVELTVRDMSKRRDPTFKADRKMVLTFPIQKLPDDLSVGDMVPAWTFSHTHGCWEKDGDGELVIDERTGNLVWKYEANHFSWWAAGRVNPSTSCVNVRTCYDQACQNPAPDTLIGIFGTDYGYETFRYTDRNGFACIQFPFGRTVDIFHPCVEARIEVQSTVRPSSCAEGNGEIPRVPDYQLREDEDDCRTATLVIPKYDRSCTTPDAVHNNLQWTKEGYEEFIYGSDVKYSCINEEDDLPSDSEGYRMCNRCFKWTGDLTCEGSEDISYTY